MMMAVLPAEIAAGDFYLRFTEVREVISIARSGDVTFLARSRTDVVGREPMRLDTRSRIRSIVAIGSVTTIGA